MRKPKGQWIITAGDFIFGPVGPFASEAEAHAYYQSRHKPKGTVYLTPPTIQRLLQPVPSSDEHQAGGGIQAMSDRWADLRAAAREAIGLGGCQECGLRGEDVMSLLDENERLLVHRFEERNGYPPTPGERRAIAEGRFDLDDWTAVSDDRGGSSHDRGGTG